MIPHSLSIIVKKLEVESIDSVLKYYSDEKSRSNILEYIEFLIENEYAIIGDLYLKQHLSEMSITDYRPEIVENSIVCISNSNIEPIIRFLNEIQFFLCNRLELRIQELSISNFEKLMSAFINSTFVSILIRSKYINELFNSSIEKIINKEQRISKHIIYNSPQSSAVDKSIYIRENTDFINDCGIIESDNFSINREVFISSSCANTCLSKKVSINFDGKLCSCPSIVTDNKYNTIESFIKSNHYNELKRTVKDEIEVCKDCEYRRMCIDCRAFTDSKERPNARPSKCGYNPYIAKWSHEKGYRNLAESGVISNEKEFSINHKRITQVNNEINEE